MLFAAGPISEFVSRHPTVKMLALSFLLLIGFSLVAEGLQFHIPKGYIYFAMGFSVLVEMLNLRLSRKSKPVQLRQSYTNEGAAAASQGTQPMHNAICKSHLPRRMNSAGCVLPALQARLRCILHFAFCILHSRCILHSC